MKLLIVDDEGIERKALRYFFSTKNLGIEVVGEAVNGIEAVELNRTLQPDIILMDIRMGILDGLKASEYIKKDNPFVEIIIITAFGLFEYSQQAIKNRVFDYLLKPIEEKDLLKSIDRVKKHINLNKEKVHNKNSSFKLFDYWLKEQNSTDKNISEIFEDERIATVIKYIMENLSKDLSLERLASLVHINSTYLSRLFKSKTGISISKFILEAKIEKAKFLLLNDKKRPLKIIAEEVGFSTIHHFCNTFKKIENITPNNFRDEEKR